MDYKLVRGSQDENGGKAGFEKRVQALLIEGWELQGGICVIFNDACYEHYYQALIKR